MITDESKKLAALAILLRVYGVLTLVIFGSLLVGFAIQTPLLADEPKGALNWVIWNGIRCGSEPCYVPPMLFIIHIVWGVFFFMRCSQPVGIRVVPQFHHVGVLGPRPPDGWTGAYAHEHSVAQISHGYPVRADPRPRHLSLATA